MVLMFLCVLLYCWLSTALWGSILVFIWNKDHWINPQWIFRHHLVRFAHSLWIKRCTFAFLCCFDIRTWSYLSWFFILLVSTLYTTGSKISLDLRILVQKHKVQKAYRLLFSVVILICGVRCWIDVLEQILWIFFIQYRNHNQNGPESYLLKWSLKLFSYPKVVFLLADTNSHHVFQYVKTVFCYLVPSFFGFPLQFSN